MNKYNKLKMILATVCTFTIISSIAIKETKAAYILEDMIGGYTTRWTYTPTFKQWNTDYWYKTVTYTGPKLKYRDVCIDSWTSTKAGWDKFRRDYYSVN